MDTPVSFELAKLLKEKGFAERCRAHWYEHNIQGKVSLGISYPQTDFNKWYRGEILAPTIAEVVMWLYKKHKIWIGVQPNEPFIDNDWCFILYRDFQRCEALEGYNSPTEAHEAAIEYVLNELI